jgi:YfiH family protein
MVPKWLDVEAWTDLEWLWRGFSTRQGGVSGPAGELNLGFTPEDSAEKVRENRLRFVESITGSRAAPLATVTQVHSNRVVVLREGNQGKALDQIPQADGILTDQPGLLLGIQTADCIPVLVADRRLRVVGAFHAGWRGTVERIVERGVGQMGQEFSSKPEDLVAAIGPGIGQCCYRVGAEVRERFGERFAYAPELFSGDIDADSGLRLDLTEANRRQLLDAGLAASAISLVGGCTECNQDLYYSHRGSGGKAGRMMAVIGVRPQAGNIS